MDTVIRYIPLALIFTFSFLFMFITHKRFRENNVWGKVVRKYKDNTSARMLTEAEFVTKYGAVENHSLLYRADRLMLVSGIKNTFKFIDGEVFIGMLLAAGVAGLLEGEFIFGNALVAIFLACAQVTLLYMAALAMAGKTYNQIEDGTSLFVSILSNHAKGSSDIVTIFQNTIPSLSGPIRRITEKFVADAENTGNVDIAFDYMKESVDNRQLQTIFVNLKNCMHYQANYEEVLAQMMRQVAAGLTAREERKNILFSMKLTLLVISLMAVVIVLVIGQGLDIDVMGSMTGTAIGQMILLITGIMYLLVGIKMFKTDK